MKKREFLSTIVSFWLAALIIVGGDFAVDSVRAAPPVRPLLATCVVTNTNDSGSGSLRQCMLSAGTGDSIIFNSTVFPPGSPATIALTSALPTITTNNLTIDGSTAGVILDGSGTSPGTNGFVINGANGVVIKGLQILNFPASGIRITNGANNTIGGDTPGESNLISGNGNNGVDISNSDSNTISGNYIGTNRNGTAAVPNGSSGVDICCGASNNTVGGDTAGERNLISGNGFRGVNIINSGTMSNTIRGNYIGTNIGGTAALGNTWNGLRISDGASFNIIRNNLISGNGLNGVGIADNGTNHNKVQSNYIGTDATGTSPIGNDGNGVTVIYGAQYNLIGGNNATPGGPCSGECNLISGNGGAGIEIQYNGTTNNTVSGNYIGVDVNGLTALGNGDNGVYIGPAAPQDNLIGGDTADERNLISGNGRSGVVVSGSGTMNNTVSGNYIGTDVSGTGALPNSVDGVGIGDGASNNHIGLSNATPGSACTGGCNLISGNGTSGVAIVDTGTMSNTIINNYIGTNVSGATAISNTADGVNINSGPQGNIITENLISGNGSRGVAILSNTTGNSILSNSIFANESLGIDLNGDGVTPNDSGDGDTGSNNLQNFPVLTSAESSGSAILINVTFNSLPNTNYTFQFFANNACDPSNYGEGVTFLTTVTRTTASTGNASFAVFSLTPVPIGQFISATATDPNGNTSEFSQCVLVNAFESIIYLPIIKK